jgi:hypoxanthine phosphoribosyltransferase
LDRILKKMNRYYVDWDEIHSLVFRLCHKILTNDQKFKNIYGLQRGGLIPAVMLSHQLGIPMAKGDIGPNTLIVDDICDSGETLDKLIKKYQTLYSYPFNLKTAVLHYKPHTSCFEPTSYAEKWNKDVWLIYPWEKEDSKSIQDYKVKVGDVN